MITADHKNWADCIFYYYLKRLLKRHFYAIHLINSVPDFDPDKPLLILPNHNSWWDGFFIYLLNKKLIRRNIYLMMLEDQLKINQFFRLIGAYSIKPSSINEVKQSLEYTVKLLNRKDENLLVCIFPQGELQSWYKKPYLFKKGIEYILSKIGEINLCFLAMRIEFLNEQLPEVFIRFSVNYLVKADAEYSQKESETVLNTLLVELENDILNNKKGELIFCGNQSINERYQSFRNHWRFHLFNK